MIEELLKRTEHFIDVNSAKESEELLSILKFSNISEDEHEVLGAYIDFVGTSKIYKKG